MGRMTRISTFVKKYRIRPGQAGVYVYNNRNCQTAGCCVGGWYHSLINECLLTTAPPENVVGKDVGFFWRISSIQDDKLLCDFLVSEGIISQELLDITDTFEYGGYAYRGLVLQDGVYTGRQMAMVYQLTRHSYEHMTRLDVSVKDSLDGFVEALDEIVGKDDPLLRRVVALMGMSCGHGICISSGKSGLSLAVLDSCLSRTFGHSKEVKTNILRGGTTDGVQCGWSAKPNWGPVWNSNKKLEKAFKDITLEPHMGAMAVPVPNSFAQDGRTKIHAVTLMRDFVNAFNTNRKVIENELIPIANEMADSLEKYNEGKRAQRKSD